MYLTLRAAIAGAILVASSQAHATDWWWVAGEPDDQAIQFIDADAVSREKLETIVQVTSVERSGRSSQNVQRFRCDLALASEDQPVRQFACGAPAERMESAAMLGSMTPQQASRAIFAAKRPIQDFQSR